MFRHLYEATSHALLEEMDPIDRHHLDHPEEAEEAYQEAVRIKAEIGKSAPKAFADMYKKTLTGEVQDPDDLEMEFVWEHRKDLTNGNTLKMKMTSGMRKAVKLLNSGPILEGKSDDLKAKALSLGVDVSGMSVAQIEEALARAIWEKENPGVEMPDQFSPMLAHEISKKGPDFLKTITPDKYWLQEKANGMRSLMNINGSRVVMTSRVRGVANHRFSEHQDSVPHFRDMSNPFTGKTVLDGELTHPMEKIDTGSTITNSKLQVVIAMTHAEESKGIAMQKKYGPLEYNAFDILFYNGKDVRNLPYDEREPLVAQAVSELLAANPGLPMRAIATDKEYTDVNDIFQSRVAKGQEGVMIKNRKGKYMHARSHDLLKMKRDVTVDGFITGFTKSSAAARAELIGGFVVSSFVDGKQQVIASISGISEAVRKEASVIVDGQLQLNPDFLNRCMEIKGQEFNASGLLQHARFVEWRTDKNPQDCYVSSEDMQIPGRE